MDNLEKKVMVNGTIKNGQSREKGNSLMDNQEWTIQRHW